MIVLLFLLLRLVACMQRGDLRDFGAFAGIAAAGVPQEPSPRESLVLDVVHAPSGAGTRIGREAAPAVVTHPHRSRDRRVGVPGGTASERTLAHSRRDFGRLCRRHAHAPELELALSGRGHREPQWVAMPTPDEVKRKAPLTGRAAQTVMTGRSTLRAILDRRDPRLFVVVGPCSIHDPVAAREYAVRLAGLAADVAETMLLVMRVYLEKPRTSVGWKGFINDPHLDGSFRMDEGVTRARRLLLDIAEMGLPAATEALDPMSPQYVGDLVSWYAIGARTTESQTHREMASGLAAPVGFKNGTDGGLDVAFNAIKSAASPHRFIGMNRFGRPSIVHTSGNGHGHLVLRGGGGRPNYSAADVRRAEDGLAKTRLAPNIVVDCSHENSLKDPWRQPLVVDDCVQQIIAGNRSIVGLMLESHLHAGNQPIPTDLSTLRYGVSVTDACIDWATTEDAIRRAHAALAPVIAARREG